jgi:hypothetical protein
MFQLYKTISYLAKKDSTYTLEYEITDSEFGTVPGVIDIEERDLYYYELTVTAAIIQEYSKRGLNVAANLAVAFNWIHKQYPYFSTQNSIQDIINLNKKNNPLFQQYEEDLQKYLVLI